MHLASGNILYHKVMIELLLDIKNTKKYKKTQKNTRKHKKTQENNLQGKELCLIAIYRVFLIAVYLLI